MPLTVSEPVLVVTQLLDTRTPHAPSVPHAALPVIVTLPVPVAEMLVELSRKTPLEEYPVPHEVPFNVIEPVLVVTQLVNT